MRSLGPREVGNLGTFPGASEPPVHATEHSPSPDTTMDAVRINQRLVIPASELQFRATRSGGPGGQHANTSATRIELTWNPASSESLSDRRRELILSGLSNRLDSEGTLRLVCDTHRSQLQNRKEVTDRFADLVAGALRPRKARKKTRPTRASKERRLQAKKQRGQKKKLRGRVRRDDPF